jgi:CRP/FNR family cyclic AMP-dependent transcriptional regulator
MNSPKDTAFEPVCAPLVGTHRCELEENVDILRRVPAFSLIPLERLKVYAYVCKRFCYRKGEFLFRQGDTDSRAYIMVSGNAQVVRERKNHSIFLNELKEGDFFGGLALLSEVKRLFSVKAITEVQCLALDRESFRKLLTQFPEVALNVLEPMINRIVQMEEILLDSYDRTCVYG